MGTSCDDVDCGCSLTEEYYLWNADGRLSKVEDVLTENHADFTGWAKLEVRDMSSDGTVLVGRGVNPDGATEAWIAKIKPFE